MEILLLESIMKKLFRKGILIQESQVSLAIKTGLKTILGKVIIE